jgi:hypothetical protein
MSLSKRIKRALAAFKKPKNVHISVDVDPMSVL